MKLWKLISASIGLVLSTSVNAVVLNTLNGIDYEWLELTETQGLSRNQVELMLNDSNSALHGYEYASRDLVEDLFHSYTPWSGFGGVHEAPEVVSGIYSLQSDFGFTASFMSNDIGSLSTTEGTTMWYDGYDFTGGFYGLESECGLDNETCLSALTTYLDTGGNLLASLQHYRQGWDSSVNNPFIDTSDTVIGSYGSYLVKVSAVPVPAAVWLFGSGLIGLVGFARRKKA